MYLGVIEGTRHGFPINTRGEGVIRSTQELARQAFFCYKNDDIMTEFRKYDRNAENKFLENYFCMTFQNPPIDSLFICYM